jgi:hypothetical protein
MLFREKKQRPRVGVALRCYFIIQKDSFCFLVAASIE